MTATRPATPAKCRCGCWRRSGSSSPARAHNAGTTLVPFRRIESTWQEARTVHVFLDFRRFAESIIASFDETLPRIREMSSEWVKDNFLVATYEKHGLLG